MYHQITSLDWTGLEYSGFQSNYTCYLLLVVVGLTKLDMGHEYIQKY